MQIDYKPRFPDAYRPAVGIIGCGGIVRSAHLPAYQKYSVAVAGAYDINPDALAQAQQQFGVRPYESVEALLADPAVQVVDIATHPAQRVELIRRALAAGKHVLAQKPLALDVRDAEAVVREARERGLTLAVNQNGRWAPAWRIATLLVEGGAVGDVLAVTHMFDTSFAWVTGTVFDGVAHWGLYDYAIHWIDITRCWMGDAAPDAVRAREYRTPVQHDASQASWGTLADFSYPGGASALIRGVGCSQTKRAGHPFWIHGSAGTIRGSVLGVSDWVELERDGAFTRYHLEGAWFPDGFGGTMGELLCAVAEGREPSNSAAHNLLSLRMTLAACASADVDGAPVSVEG
jgi:predicted dehydrogenase